MSKKVKNTIPVYDIQSLQEVENKEKQVIALPFSDYLEIHPNLHAPHRHTFYHMLLFTNGSGHHTIDFEQFPVVPGQIYFMVPGQVHSWSFEGEVDGYIVNYSSHLCHSLLKDGNYSEQFSFLQGIAKDSVIVLPQDVQQVVEGCFRTVIDEVRTNRPLANDMICAQLMSLFINVHRCTGADAAAGIQNHLVLFNFRKLVNTYFAEKKLPKEYAAMLYITPNHLNALCRDLLNMSAGEVIRERILLEARRLLVNVDIGISEIAYRLNFTDNSYFTKFFKKYIGITPEEFRKKHQ